MRSLTLRITALLLGWSGTSPLIAQTTLAWKLAPGDAFLVEHVIVQDTSLETKNKPFRQKSALTLQTRWQVKEIDQAGARLTVTVESMASKVYSGDGKPAPAAKEDDLWRGAALEVMIDQQARLRDLQGYVQLLKKLAGNDAQRLKVLTALRPPESFRALLQDALGPLPAKPVASGDRWQHDSTDMMGIFGSFQQTTGFTYRDMRAGLHVVETSTKSTFQAPRYAVENDVFRVLKGEVRADEGKGEFLFDVVQGRMRRIQKSLKLNGTLTLETLSGMQTVAFQSATEATMVVSDIPKK